jgi:hypothetical protein
MQEMKRALEALDIEAAQRIWAQAAPHLAQPLSDENALASLHIARTGAESIAFRLRAYSHSWLVERGFPSQLPDRLKPRAQRLYPRVVTGVGIAVMSRSAEMRPVAERLRLVQAEAVEDCYADGREEPEYVKARMAEAKAKERLALFGRVGLVKVGAI